MGLISRLAANRVSDPAIGGRFYVYFPFEDIANADRTFVEIINPPHPKVAANGRFYGGKPHYFPGFADIDPIALTVFETDDLFVTREIIKWAKLRYNYETDDYGLPINYMRDLSVLQFSGKNSDTPVLTSVYQRCWPTDHMPSQLQYGQIDDRLTVVLNLSTDGVIYKGEGL